MNKLLCSCLVFVAGCTGAQVDKGLDVADKVLDVANDALPVASGAGLEPTVVAVVSGVLVLAGAVVELIRRKRKRSKRA